jgi:hypothetical protein
MPMKLTKKVRLDVCVHEAAHAVISALGRVGVFSVEVAPLGATEWVTEGRKGGELTDLWGICRTSDQGFASYFNWNEANCEYDFNSDLFTKSLRLCPSRSAVTETYRAIRADVCGIFAGPIADQIREGCDLDNLYLEPVDPVPGDDLVRAQAFCRLLPFRDEFWHLADETYGVLKEPEIQQMVARTAYALEVSGKLEGRELNSLLPQPRRNWPPSSFGKKLT